MLLLKPDQDKLVGFNVFLKEKPMKDMDIQDLMTTDEVAEMLRMTPGWVREACRRDDLPHFKIGSQYRFQRHQIQATIARLAS